MGLAPVIGYVAARPPPRAPGFSPRGCLVLTIPVRHRQLLPIRPKAHVTIAAACYTMVAVTMMPQ